MLRRFSVSNFRSFQGEVTLDLTLTGRDKTQGFYRSRGRKKTLYTSTAAGIFGANGSGKSNILTALQTACNIATGSAWILKPEDELPIIPWFNSPRPCVFRLEWSSDKHLYEYELLLTRTKIEYETLLCTSLSGKHQKETLFIRKEKEIIETSDTFGKLNNNLLRENVSYLSLARQQGITGEVVGEMSLMTPCPFDGERERPPLLVREEVAWKYLDSLLRGNDKKEFLTWAVSVIKKCDLGISDIYLEEEASKTDESGKTSFTLYGVHKTEKEKKHLAFKWESEGTRILFSYLIYIFLCKKHGGILFLDEFDSALHPDMQRKILSFFKNNEENPKGAQIIFTTHATQLMNSLGKAHVYLCEKQENMSEIWRLDDIGGVKSSDNFTRKYLGGQYGAVPI